MRSCLAKPATDADFDRVVRAGDVLLCQSHVDVHGNTPITKHSTDAKRLSFVVYLKHALATAINRLDAPPEPSSNSELA